MVKHARSDLIPRPLPLCEVSHGPEVFRDLTNAKRQRITNPDVVENECVERSSVSQADVDIVTSTQSGGSQNDSDGKYYPCTYTLEDEIAHTFGVQVGFVLLKPRQSISLYTMDKKELLCTEPALKFELLVEKFKWSIEGYSFTITGETDCESPNSSEGDSDIIFMERPDASHQRRFNSAGWPVSDVSIHSELAKYLLPHQIEGVKFLYKSVMSMRPLIDVKATLKGKQNNQIDGHEFSGGILADHMGLGKTLQTITLIEMLLNQNCYLSPHVTENRTVERVLILCSKSLISMWSQEFDKWLPQEVSVECFDSNSSFRSRINSEVQVAIMNYEKARIHADDIITAEPNFDLLVCDEAHKLKGYDARITKAIKSLRIPRKVFLTGTLVQNNVTEYYNLFNLIAPSYLGNRDFFRLNFRIPIEEGRQIGCERKHKLLAEKRIAILREVTAPLYLRREANVLDNLPTKQEFVIFCNPSPLQHEIYSALAGEEEDSAKGLLRIIVDEERAPLEGVLFLRKLCETPDLLIKDNNTRAKSEGTYKILRNLPNDILPTKVTEKAEISGKLVVLMKLLSKIREETKDRVIVVSYYTMMLNVIEKLCIEMKYAYARFDGTIEPDARKAIANKFGSSEKAREPFILLLSAKSGKEGLNLTGANRLILVDGDWNPSNDFQAMARIHRHGQEKDCFIYRLVLTGTIDEKIFQRQISKIDLSDILMGKSLELADDNTIAKLLEIYRYDEDKPCTTHTFVKCPCNERGVKTEESINSISRQMTGRLTEEDRKRLGSCLKWEHYDFSQPNRYIPEHFEILKQIIEESPMPQRAEGEGVLNSSKPSGDIFYVFYQKSHGQPGIIDLSNDDE